VVEWLKGSPCPSNAKTKIKNVQAFLSAHIAFFPSVPQGVNHYLKEVLFYLGTLNAYSNCPPSTLSFFLFQLCLPGTRWSINVKGTPQLSSSESRVAVAMSHRINVPIVSGVQKNLSLVCHWQSNKPSLLAGFAGEIGLAKALPTWDVC
jgi:hypothetical protein